MTSFQQIGANRRNAQLSTGPRQKEVKVDLDEMPFAMD
jgi:hypothetical protein